jgi:hypothetical protein
MEHDVNEYEEDHYTEYPELQFTPYLIPASPKPPTGRRGTWGESKTQDTADAEQGDEDQEHKKVEPEIQNRSLHTVTLVVGLKISEAMFMLVEGMT